MIHFYDAKLQNYSAKQLPIMVNISYNHTLHTAKLQNIPRFFIKKPTIHTLTLLNRRRKTIFHSERFSNT